MSKTIDNRLGVRLDIFTRKGATLNRTYHLQVLSGDTYYDYDLNAFSGATMQVRTKVGSPFAELTFTTDNGTIVLGNEGRLNLNQTAEVMNTIRAGEYEYDLYLKSATIPKRDLIYGLLIIDNKITN